MNTKESFCYGEGYYSQMSNGWNQVSFPIISRILSDAIRTHSPRRLLDFGSGSGIYAKTLAQSGGEVDACDVSEYSVEACKGMYHRAFKSTDSSVLSSNEYDMIFSTEVLEHIPDYRATLVQFHQALRSRGVVVLTTTTYARSVFIMLYEYKKNRRGLGGMVMEIGRWLAGFVSESRGDRFIQQWCFEPLGGHYHGFRPGKLLKAFRQSGFTILESKPLYIAEPIAMPFLYTYKFSDIMAKREWSMGKRWGALMLFMIAHPLNRVFKALGLFANNVAIIAQKGQ